MKNSQRKKRTRKDLTSLIMCFPEIFY